MAFTDIRWQCADSCAQQLKFVDHKFSGKVFGVDSQTVRVNRSGYI